MRRANGSGSIFKVKDAKRRKPWRVNVTLGVVINEETGKARQRTASLGYFATRAEAEEALVNYNACPYDLKTKADAWLIVRIIFNSPVSESYFRYVMQKVDNVFECIDNKTFKQTYSVKSFSIVPIDYEF